jgi:hypothetical protein
MQSYCCKPIKNMKEVQNLLQDAYLKFVTYNRRVRKYATFMLYSISMYIKQLLLITNSYI